jgi:hypothetical protein
MDQPTRAQRQILVVTAIAALLAIPATYACLRAYDVLFKSEANPASVIWSAKIAMFWRLGIGAYVAGMVAPLAFLGARADLDRAVRVLATSAVVVAAMIAFQGLFLP